MKSIIRTTSKLHLIPFINILNTNNIRIPDNKEELNTIKITHGHQDPPMVDKEGKDLSPEENNC
jgi:hypothetical protein